MVLSLYVTFSLDTLANMILFEIANPILFLVLAVYVKITQQCIIDSNSTGLECLSNGLCLPNNYEKNNSPTKPIQVLVNMDIIQISEVDDALGTVEIVLNVVLRWNDNRLIIKNTTEVKDEGAGYSIAPGNPKLSKLYPEPECSSSRDLRPGFYGLLVGAEHSDLSPASQKKKYHHMK